jgi:1-acyl-sn-glycerol-3-phosphate acyltransferase
MNVILRWLFFVVVVRPVVLFLIGVNVRHREKLPERGPAVIIANHNSHLDAMVLMSLMPLHLLPRVRPVAAADYFLRKPLLRWFSTRIVGIIPMQRSGHADGHPLREAFEALEAGSILVFFPEGTRGEPEIMSSLQRGIGHIARRFPDTPFSPVFLHGLGKALPKGEALLVPFFCDVYVGDPIYGSSNINSFMQEVQTRLEALRTEAGAKEWV